MKRVNSIILKIIKKSIFYFLILMMPYMNLTSKAMLGELEKDEINTTVVPYKRSNVYDLDEFKFVRECAEKYARKHALSIEPAQCCIFSNRETARCQDSNGLFFCPPENAIKVAVKVEVEFPFRNLDEQTQGWRIVYHGTKCDDAFSIAKNGFNPNLTLRGKGSYGPGIYLTPSWTLASALALSWQDAETSDGKKFGTVLQCRIRPGSETEHRLGWPESIAIPSNLKAEMPLSSEGGPDYAKCELRVQNPNDIVIYGILFKQDQF